MKPPPKRQKRRSVKMWGVFNRKRELISRPEWYREDLRGYYARELGERILPVTVSWTPPKARKVKHV